MVNLSTLKITLDMLSMVAGIDEFKGEWKSVGQIAPERLDLLQQLAVIENIGASSRMEGGKINDQEVLLFLNNKQDQKFKSDEERFVAGHAAVLDNIYRNHAHIAFSVSTVLQLHKELYGHSVGDGLLSGQQDESDNLRSEESTKEKPDLPITFDELISWAVDVLDKKKLHPLVAIGIFNAVFLALQPFNEGNGPLSRILTQFLLLKAGYGFVPYCALEAQVEHGAEVYYRAFKQTGESLKSKAVNWQPSVIIFLKTLQKNIYKLEQKLERDNSRLNRLPDLSLQLIELIRAKGRITISEASLLTRSNPTKVRKHLDTMVSAHHLQKHGTTKGMWYSMNT